MFRPYLLQIDLLSGNLEIFSKDLLTLELVHKPTNVLVTTEYISPQVNDSKGNWNASCRHSKSTNLDGRAAKYTCF